MELRYATIARKARIEPLVRAYLFEGAEDALKQEALDKLTAQLVDPGSKDFDLEIVEGKTLTPDRLFAAAGVPPFASQKRMVIIRRANGIPSAEQESIAKKIERIPESSVVVLVVPAPEVKDGKVKAGSKISSELSKAIGSVGAIVSFAGLRPEDAVREAGRKVSEAGKKIDGTALRRLVDRVGSDLTILDSEIRKLVDYTGDRTSITIRDVEQVTEQKPEELVWRLIDAIGARNTPLALRLLRESLESGGNVDREAPRLLALILRQLRLIWQARVVADKGWRLQTAPDEAMDLLPSDGKANVLTFCKSHQFQVRKLEEQARNFTLADLEKCFDYAAAADLATKGVEGDIVDSAIIMELLVINLCRRRRSTTQTRDNL